MRELTDLIKEETPVFTDAALSRFQDKDERRYNSRGVAGRSAFQAVSDNKKHYDKIRVSGVGIDSFIANL
jgi:hypothetical protein